MKVILQQKAGDTSVFEEGTLPRPSPTGSDILIRNIAVSVNPVDTKVRSGAFIDKYPLVLGWDGAGVVEEVGENVKQYKVGDEVMYSGSIVRAGSNGQYTLVDERIVGKKPKSLTFPEAAALPLTALTAWEALVEQLMIPVPEAASTKNPKTLLIINGAGGVGSLATQFAAKVLNVEKVVTTASRPETVEWCKKMGATHVLDHHQDIKKQLVELQLAVDYVFICHTTEKYLPLAQEIIQPFGRIVSIVEVENPLPFSDLSKALTFSWEFMFAKSMHNYDMPSQSLILNRVADLVDSGVIQSTVTETLDFSVDGLSTAHKMIESGKVIGKITLDMKHWA